LLSIEVFFRFHTNSLLKQGFIGVVLRGQRLDDHGRVSKELDIPGALEHERNFFASEPAYRFVCII
jgi:hypothetical protein